MDLTVHVPACPREFFVPVVRQEFNYPPCLTVVHFDPVNDAIPVLARDTVLRMRMLWYAIMAILFFNGRSATPRERHSHARCDEAGFEISVK